MKASVIARNNVHISGLGARTIIFAHGFGCDQTLWRLVAPAFEADFRVVKFDYVGSGKSDLSAYDPSRYATLDGYAQDVLEICEELDLREAIFVGHSVSSMIGVLAAIARPEYFSRLVLIGPSPCYLNHPPEYAGGFERTDLEGLLDMMSRNFLGWASFLAPVIVKNQERPELAGELERSFCAIDRRVAQQFAAATFFADNRADLPKLTVPALVMQCSDDSIAPVAVGDYVHRHLRHSTFKQLAASGHCPHLSHPQETIQVINDYVAAL